MSKPIVDFCNFCEKPKVNKVTYPIIRLIVNTTKNQYFIGLFTILPKLNEFAFHKGLHLSATQIILLRQDIFLEFVSSFYREELVKEKIVNWDLEVCRICSECFEEQKEEIPER